MDTITLKTKFSVGDAFFIPPTRHHRPELFILKEIGMNTITIKGINEYSLILDDEDSVESVLKRRIKKGH